MFWLRNKKIDFQLRTVLEVRSQGYKTLSCSTPLSTNDILLINVKMPTIVGSMINTTFEGLKARNFVICQYFSVYEQCTVELSMKKGPGCASRFGE